MSKSRELRTLLLEIQHLAGQETKLAEDVHACLESALSVRIAKESDLQELAAELGGLLNALLTSGEEELSKLVIETIGRIALRAIELEDLSPRIAIQFARGLHSMGLGVVGSDLLDTVAELMLNREPGADAAAVAQVLNTRGEILRELHEFDAAEQSLSAALRAAEAASAPEALSAILNNLGLVAFQTGDFERAAECLYGSLDCGAESGIDEYAVAITKDNIANVEINLARAAGPLEPGDGCVNTVAAAHLRRAGELLEQSKSVFEANLPNSAADLATWFMHASSLAELQNDFGRFETLTLACLDLVEEAGLSDRLLAGAISHRTKALIEADRHEDIIELVSTKIGTQASAEPNWSSAFADCAEAACILGDGDLTEKAVRAAAAIDDVVLERILSNSSEDDAARRFQEFRTRAERLIGVSLACLETTDCPPWIYDISLNRKGVLSERIGSAWLRNLTERAGTAEHFEQLKSLRFDAIRADLDGAGDDFIHDARRRQAQLSRQVAEAEAEILRSIPGTRSIDWISTEDIQSCLDAETVLLDFVHVQNHDERRYVTFWISADGLEFRDLGNAQYVDEQISRLLEELSDPGGHPPDAWQETARVLSDLVIDPEVQIPRNIWIAPTALFYWLPFAALRKPDGIILLEEHVITAVQSGRSIARKSFVVSNTRTLESSEPVVLGGADFDLDFSSEIDFFLLQRHGHLPHSENEAREIAALLGVAPKLGRQATREVLLELSGPKILHIATHGAFLQAHRSVAEQTEAYVSVVRNVGGVVREERLDSGSMMKQAGPYAGDSEKKRLHKIRKRWLAEIGPTHPASRSVLLLAGANAWLAGVDVPSDVGNGMLTAGELALVNLTCTELVVLSACETATGPIGVGDGSLVGLRSAAMLAGAANCISTLWKVDDAAAAQLTAGFYRNFAKGLSPGEALRATQLDERQENPHPFYWAGWVADGRPSQVADAAKAANGVRPS